VLTAPPAAAVLPADPMIERIAGLHHLNPSTQRKERRPLLGLKAGVSAPNI
jgi:hypothetical protein